LTIPQIREITRPIEEGTAGNVGMTHILVTGASGLLGLNFALHTYRKHKNYRNGA